MKKRILWIDDEVDNLGSLIFFLKNVGYEVDAVPSGIDGLNKLISQKYDMILLDQMMPGMDGLSVLEEIRKRDPFIPVVMFTKMESEDMMDAAYSFSVNNFLIKPVKPQQLLAVCKGILEKDTIEKNSIPKNYTNFARTLQMEFTEDISPYRWIEIYTEFTLWKLRIESKNRELISLYSSLLEEMDSAFFRTVKDNYRDWINDSDFIMSYNIVENVVFEIMNNKPVFFILIDCLRFDQYLSIEKILKGNIVKRDMYFSILPTATPYARNSIFSGMMPYDISKKYPDLWDMEDEISQNRYEDRFWISLMSKKVHEGKISYYKIHSESEFGEWFSSWKSKQPIYAEALVINHLDTLIHHRSKEESLQNLIPTENAISSITGSWAENSYLVPTIETALKKGYFVFLTTDHGSIMVNKPSIVKGGKEVSWNLRYKFGQTLKCNSRDALLIEDPSLYGLPVRKSGERWCVAWDSIFFVYPTNPSLYTKQYKNTFQHGGITTGEMIIPYAVIDT